MRILFFGTSTFAACILKYLINSGYQALGVVTQPDKPKGRGKKIVSPPVKKTAEEAVIPIFQPTSCKDPDFLNSVRSLEPDFLVVAAYGQILPGNLLGIPSQAPINVHASLLPKYRGAAPIQWAIINGEEITGVTTMFMDEGMDTGDILLTDQTRIGKKETAGSLHDRLTEMGGPLLIKTLDEWMEKTIIRQPQDHTKATYAPPLKKKDGHICWEKPAKDIERKIRGMIPWPGAYGTLDGKRIKILEADVVNQTSSAPPGTIIKADNGGFDVSCASGILSIKRLQMEGKKPLLWTEFARGLKHTFKGETIL